jgi:hypothetical protein
MPTVASVANIAMRSIPESQMRIVDRSSDVIVIGDQERVYCGARASARWQLTIDHGISVFV